jgi:diaminopimelate decarboxylase
VPVDSGGRLFVEDCDADALARRFGTPIHVISEDQLRRNARRYQREFQQRWSEGPVVADVFMRDLVPERLRVTR